MFAILINDIRSRLLFERGLSKILMCVFVNFSLYFVCQSFSSQREILYGILGGIYERHQIMDIALIGPLFKLKETTGHWCS